MELNAYAAGKRLAIYDSLVAGEAPSEGVFDEPTWIAAKAKGRPQMGPTSYTPNSIRLEFIFPDSHGESIVLTVVLDAPERIVMMPVPDWVVESIWQGEVSGSFHFETDALNLLSAFQRELQPDANQRWFEKQPAKRRE